MPLVNGWLPLTTLTRDQQHLRVLERRVGLRRPRCRPRPLARCRRRTAAAAARCRCHCAAPLLSGLARADTCQSSGLGSGGKKGAGETRCWEDWQQARQGSCHRRGRCPLCAQLMTIGRSPLPDISISPPAAGPARHCCRRQPSCSPSPRLLLGLPSVRYMQGRDLRASSRMRVVMARLVCKGGKAPTHPRAGKTGRRFAQHATSGGARL